MISCPNCGKDSADDAKHCGYCGSKLKPKRSKSTMFGMAAIPDADLEKLRAKLEAEEAEGKASADSELGSLISDEAEARAADKAKDSDASDDAPADDAPADDASEAPASDDAESFLGDLGGGLGDLGEGLGGLLDSEEADESAWSIDGDGDGNADPLAATAPNAEPLPDIGLSDTLDADRDVIKSAIQAARAGSDDAKEAAKTDADADAKDSAPDKGKDAKSTVLGMPQYEADPLRKTVTAGEARDAALDGGAPADDQGSSTNKRKNKRKNKRNRKTASAAAATSAPAKDADSDATRDAKTDDAKDGDAKTETSKATDDAAPKADDKADSKADNEAENTGKDTSAKDDSQDDDDIPLTAEPEIGVLKGVAETSSSEPDMDAWFVGGDTPMESAPEDPPAEGLASKLPVIVAVVVGIAILIGVFALVSMK